MRAKYRQWAVDYLDEHPDIVLDKINFQDEFFTSKPIHIEIGSGKGDFIVGMAKKYPDANFLAVERVRTIAGMLAKKVVEEGINNVKVFPNDISLIFDEIKDNSLDAIYLNFVDPWPKKKHAKRRLTFITCLNQYYRILKPGAKVVFKSDNDGLYEYSVEEATNTKFKLILKETNYLFDDVNDVMTEYEKKFREKGKNINRFVLEK